MKTDWIYVKNQVFDHTRNPDWISSCLKKKPFDDWTDDNEFDIKKFLFEKASRVEILDFDTALRLAAPRKPIDGIVAEITLNGEYIFGFEDSYNDIKKYFSENNFFKVLKKPIDKEVYLSSALTSGYISNYRESKDKAFLETIFVKESFRNNKLATNVLEFLIKISKQRANYFVIENILTEKNNEIFKGNLEKFKRIAEKLKQGNIIEDFEFKHQGKIIDLELLINRIHKN